MPNGPGLIRLTKLEWSKLTPQARRGHIARCNVHVVNDMGEQDISASQLYFNKEVAEPRLGQNKHGVMMWGRLPRWPLEGMIDITIKREAFGTYTRRPRVHRGSANC